jgi:hypothetical protein
MSQTDMNALLGYGPVRCFSWMTTVTALHSLTDFYMVIGGAFERAEQC